MFRLELVSDYARFEQLEAEWNRLADAMGSPLLRHEWFLQSGRAFTPEARLAVQVAWEGERIRAAAPLVFKRIGPAVRLQLLGAESFEPEGFLYDDMAALAQVCAAVARLRRPVVLSRLHADGGEIDGLEHAQGGRGLVVVRTATTRTYCNPIPVPDWGAFQTAMSSGRRKELERKRRKLEKEGVVRFEAAAPDQAAFEPLYQEFVELEGSGWKAANGTAIAQKPASFRFYRDYGRRLCELGMLRLFLLRLNGELVAAQYHVLHAGKLWELKIAYREALGRHSPGALLTHEILRWGCEHGVRGLEHLGAAEEWQTRWPVETREHSTVRLYPAGPVGGVALAWDSADFLRRRVQARRGGPAEPQETGESANS